MAALDAAVTINLGPSTVPVDDACGRGTGLGVAASFESELVPHVRC
jgi:hypothetical protein